MAFEKWIEAQLELANFDEKKMECRLSSSHLNALKLHLARTETNFTEFLTSQIERSVVAEHLLPAFRTSINASQKPNWICLDEEKKEQLFNQIERLLEQDATLTHKERDFLVSVQAYIDERGIISEKQHAVLDLKIKRFSVSEDKGI